MGDARTLRYGWPWHAIGALGIVLAFAFPLLMSWNHETITAGTIAGFAAMGIAGLAYLLYCLRFRVIVSDEGLEIRTLWAERRFHWREVVLIRPLKKVLRFELADGRRVDVTLDTPNVREVFVAAGAHVPETVWRNET